MTIENLLKQRNIKYLCHFTRLENLKSILTHGLIPRDNLYDPNFNTKLAPKTKIHGIFNDTLRLDNHTNAVCLSVSFPNSQMFYKLRCDNPSSQWAVIILNAQILIDKNCAFYPINAASHSVNEEDIMNYQGTEALKKLFEGDENSRQYLLDKDPTNVQAEILVFDKIEPSYILEVVLMSDKAVTFFKENFAKFGFIKHGYWDVFSDRYNARKNGFKR